jgi:hypothetical protein
MTESSQPLTNQALRTPRAAAISGIIFGVLSITTYLILNLYVPALEDDSGEWLTTHMNAVSFALALIPFAGIAFLWFMGVARDLVGMLEDRFFSTLFLGSGFLYLGLVFSGGVMAGGLILAYRLDPSNLTEGDIFLFARAVIFRINTVYMIRMAGMFMIVQATIWMRTQVMPRWAVVITYILALIQLFGINLSLWITEVFPIWVLLISTYLLILTYRSSELPEEGSTPE